MNEVLVFVVLTKRTTSNGARGNITGSPLSLTLQQSSDDSWTERGMQAVVLDEFEEVHLGANDHSAGSPWIVIPPSTISA